MTERQIAQNHLRECLRYEPYAKRRFYRALKEMVKPVLIDFNYPVHSLHMQLAYQDVYQYIGVQSAISEYKRLRKQEPTKADPLFQLLLNTWSVWMRGYVRASLGQMIQKVTDNTQKKINEALQESVTTGATTKQTAKAIYKETLGQIGRARAETIARTETNRAVNVGKEKSANDWAQEIGAELYKKWLHTERKTERHWHADESDKPPIAASENFQVYNPNTGTVEYLNLPCDQSASAENSVNCNCVALFMSKTYAERRYNLYG